MPYRRLPRTDDARSTALNRCYAKYNATTNPSDRLITPAQFATLSSRLSLWAGARDALRPLLQGQTAATAAVNASALVLEHCISHFIQVFNLGVTRGVFPASSRTCYALDASSDSVPTLDSGADLQLWGARIGAGETVRVAGGGTPMAMPSAAQVSAALSVYTDAETTQSTAKSAFDRGQEAVSSQRLAVDALILDLWDTIEFHLRANDPPSLRRKAREWGVFYEGDAEAPPAPPE